MALATTFDLPNFVGELFNLNPDDRPFLSMIGGLTGGKTTESKDIVWQTKNISAGTQPAIIEGAAPTTAQVARAEVNNVTQIFQYGVEISYTKLAAIGQLGNPLAAATAILGVQPVGNELTEQMQLKVEQARADVNFSFHQGTFQRPTDNTTGRKTRGMLAAITTNVFDPGTAVALLDAHVDSLTKLMVDAGAPFRMPVIFVNIFNKQALSGIYGYAPMDRNIGGVNINVIETDAARLGVAMDRDQLTTVLAIYDVSVCAPVAMPIPGKGVFFAEELGLVGAAVKAQLYGEIGLEYGPQTWHGKIVDLLGA
jgi:hypothetical protein